MQIDNPKISVIVPVYNTEKWLRRCIDSILGQTFADFELLLIDDGSTDGSGAICDEYAEADQRVRVFHKPNGGVSSARNLGLDNAKGKWITFADADDWIDVDYFDKVMAADCCNIADTIVSNFKNVHKGGTDIYKYNHKGEDLVRSIRKLLITMGGTCVWAKFFRKELIRKHNIIFPMGIRYCEDFRFCTEAYLYSSNIGYVNSCDGYNYFERESSVCQNIDDSHILEAVEMNNQIYELTVKKNVNSLYEKHICWRILSSTQDWVMVLQKHQLLKNAYPYRKRYILTCPLFWNIRQKLLVFFELNNIDFIVRCFLSVRKFLKRGETNL